MRILQRVSLSFINAFFITVVLFYCMYSLVHMREPELQPAQILPHIDWSPVPEDPPPTTIVIKPEPPKLVDTAPELPKLVAEFEADLSGAAGFGEYVPPRRKGEIPILGDNQLTLVIGFQPVYPATAIGRQIEGYAIVGFSVGKAGEVFDPYIIESEPGRVFDKSALKAIKKFRYKARHVNGKPVSTDGQRYMFTYKLEAS